MNRFYGLSTPLRFLAYAILAGMVALAVYAIISRQPPQPLLTTAQMQETADVIANTAVASTLTALAPTAAAPNIQATVDARVTQAAQGTPLPSPTPPPTATPEPSTGEQVVGVANEAVDFAGGLLVAVWNFLVGIWNFLSFGGWILQMCCCIGLPALIIIGALAER